jgi:hypothetical protein
LQVDGYKQDIGERTIDFMPLLTNDPTIVKDLQRTPSKTSLQSFFTLQQLKQLLKTYYSNAHGAHLL